LPRADWLESFAQGISTPLVLAKKLLVPEVSLSQELGSFVREDRCGVMPGIWIFGKDGFGSEGKLVKEDLGLELPGRAAAPASLFPRPLNGFHHDEDSSAHTDPVNARHTVASNKNRIAAFHLLIIHLLNRTAKAVIAKQREDTAERGGEVLQNV
jgi:hypothetical protein